MKLNRFGSSSNWIAKYSRFNVKRLIYTTNAENENRPGVKTRVSPYQENDGSIPIYSGVLTGKFTSGVINRYKSAGILLFSTTPGKICCKIE